jgi:hypothetical protein
MHVQELPLDWENVVPHPVSVVDRIGELLRCHAHRFVSLREVHVPITRPSFHKRRFYDPNKISVFNLSEPILRLPRVKSAPVDNTRRPIDESGNEGINCVLTRRC